MPRDCTRGGGSLLGNTLPLGLLCHTADELLWVGGLTMLKNPFPFHLFLCVLLSSRSEQLLNDYHGINTSHCSGPRNTVLRTCGFGTSTVKL